MGTSATLEIELKGPWPLADVFSAQDIVRGGVYLFTVPSGLQYLTYYVGETKHFDTRMRDHIRQYVSWKYWLYDTDALKNGILKAVYDPNRQLNPHRDDCDYASLFDQFPYLATVVLEMLRTFQVFLLPMDGADELRKGLEAAIVYALKAPDQPALVRDFLDVKTSSVTPRGEDAQSVHVRLKGADAIMGLPSNLVA